MKTNWKDLINIQIILITIYLCHSFCLIRSYSEPLYPNTAYKDIYADCPWRVQPGSEYLPVMVMIKDAGDNILDYDLDYVKISYQGQEIFRQDFNQKVTNHRYNLYEKGDWFSIIKLPLASANFPVDERIKLEIKFKDNGEWYDTDGDTNDEIYFMIASDSLPAMENWYSGDVHFHSHLTDNEYESGGPPQMAREAALSVGMDFLTITDHSFDMSRYKFARLIEICDSLNDDSFILLPAEEVSAKNHQGKFMHTLIYGHNEHIKGCEIDVLNLYNEEGYYLTTIIDEILNEDAFVYIAHPEVGEVEIEVPNLGWGINRGKAAFEDYQTPGLTGLEIWNTRRSIENWFGYLNEGLERWKKILAMGKRTYISAGTDAHGDFSYGRLMTDDSYPNYISDYSNGMGRVRSYVYAPEGLSENNILNAMKTGKLVCSDGPLVTFTIDDSNSHYSIADSFEIHSSDLQIDINALTTEEFGKIDSLMMIMGEINGTENYSERIISINSQPFLSDSFQIPLLRYILPGTKNTIRLEANTDRSYYSVTYRCYTNPIWIDRGATDKEDLYLKRLNSSMNGIIFYAQTTSNYWSEIVLSKFSPNGFIEIKKLSNPGKQELYFYDLSTKDTLGPDPIDTLMVSQSLQNEWFVDSLIQFKWPQTTDNLQSASYVVQGKDKSGLVIQEIENGGFEILNPQDTTLAYQFPDGQYSLIESEKGLSFKTGPNGIGPNVTINLQFNRSYLLSTSVKNNSNDTISLKLELFNSDTLVMDKNFKVSPSVEWADFLTKLDFPYLESQEITLQWLVENETAEEILFDDFYLYPLYDELLGSDSVYYHLTGINEQDTVFDTTLINDTLINYQLQGDFQSLSVTLEVHDRFGNRADSSLSLDLPPVDITPPSIDSIYWDIAEKKFAKPSSQQSLTLYADDSLVLYRYDTLVINTILSDTMSGINPDSVKIFCSGILNYSANMIPIENYESLFQIKLIPQGGWRQTTDSMLNVWFECFDYAAHQTLSDTITFSAYPQNHPPEILEISPSDTSLNLNLNDTIIFSVNVIDLDGDSLYYYWFENNQLSDSSLYYHWIPNQIDSTYIINCKITDKSDTINQNWYLNVNLTEIQKHESILNKHLIKLYPNPLKNQVFVIIEDLKQQEFVYKIINLTGQIVKKGSFKFYPPKQIYQIPLSELSSGVYFFDLNGVKLKFLKIN